MITSGENNRADGCQCGPIAVIASRPPGATAATQEGVSGVAKTRSPGRFVMCAQWRIRVDRGSGSTGTNTVSRRKNCFVPASWFAEGAVRRCCLSEVASRIL